MGNLWRYTQQVGTPGGGAPTGDPGDTVGWLWEEPSELADGTVRVRALLGCADATRWAGATVYGSANGASYAQLSRTKYRSAIGVTTNVLAAGASDWQPAGTVTVNLTASPGTLLSVDATSALAGANMALIGDELVSFQTAAFTAPNTYQLTGLVRAWYDTERVAHGIGDRFILLSPQQDRFDLPAGYVGNMWWWKAASINLQGIEQSLAAAHAYNLYLWGRGLHTQYQPGVAKQFIAGETLLPGEYVYLKAADARVWLAVTADPCRLGFVMSPQSSIAAGEKCYVQMDGVISGRAEATPVAPGWSYTAGDYLYLTAATPGAISTVDDLAPPVAMALDDGVTLWIFEARPA